MVYPLQQNEWGDPPRPIEGIECSPRQSINPSAALDLFLWPWQSAIEIARWAFPKAPFYPSKRPVDKLR